MPFAAQASAGDDERKVASAIQLGGSIKPRAEPGRRCAIGLDFAAEDQGDFGMTQLIAKPVESETTTPPSTSAAVPPATTSSAFRLGCCPIALKSRSDNGHYRSRQG